jgi:hypothetical protein
VPTLQPFVVLLEGAVARSRRVDPSDGAGRHELDHDCARLRGALVPNEVDGSAAYVNERQAVQASDFREAPRRREGWQFGAGASPSPRSRPTAADKRAAV